MEGISIQKEHLRYLAARSAVDNGDDEQRVYAYLEREYDRALGHPDRERKFLQLLKKFT